MGKIVPWSSCSFTATNGQSAGLNYGPQTLNNEPWQAINLGVNQESCHVELTEPGMYLLHGRIHFGGAFVAGDAVYFGLYDADQEYEIGDTAGFKVPMANMEWEQEFTRVYTIATGPRIIRLFAQNNTANRGTVIGLRTRIQWIRLR